MKAWTDLSAIPVPECMQHLERDARGYPIPYFVARTSAGIADFRVVDHGKWVECVTQRKCSITGLALGHWIAFVGGPQSMQMRCFTDSAMVPEAAEYAMRACPFIAAPKFGYSVAAGKDLDGVQLIVNEAMSTERPDMFGLGLTRSYRLERVQGQVVIRAAQFSNIRYWKQGQELTELVWERG